MFKRLINTVKEASANTIVGAVKQINEVRADVSEKLQESDDDFLYAVAEQEVECGKVDRGLWSKALVHADGDEARRKIHYMKLRVKQWQQENLLALKDDGVVLRKTLPKTRLLSDKQAKMPLPASQSWGRRTIQDCLNHLLANGYGLSAYQDDYKITRFGEETLVLHGKSQLVQFMNEQFGPCP